MYYVSFVPIIIRIAWLEFLPGKILLWKELWVDKNRIFDIDLLFVSPELQTQDSATFRLEVTKDCRGKIGSCLKANLSKTFKRYLYANLYGPPRCF
jgi:hypothetical protein